MALEHRSAHPNIAGIPWWGAILTAVIACLIGFAFDAAFDGARLTAAFATLYVAGCLIAVLAVAQSGLFTAVIQPPLVLFVTVPAAYFIMHRSDIQGLKDVLINCGYPLIERFPLMFFTSAAVLLIGLARWYFAKSAPAVASQEPIHAGSRTAGLSALLASLWGGRAAVSADGQEAQPGTAGGRRRTAPRAGARATREGRRSASRSRHARAAETEILDPVSDRPRRRRPRPDDDAPPERRRRADPSARREPRERTARRDPDPRERTARRDPDSRERRDPDSRPRRDPSTRQPRDPAARTRRDPAARERRDPASRQARERRTRDDRRERPSPPQERSQRRPRYADYEPADYEPADYEPFDPYGSQGPGSHHPISRVRYRGDDADDGGEFRPRRRPGRDVDADRWEYDI
ncbi:DUF6542 domain-containing protein [Mycobacterium sp. smrl_JER01]